MSAAIWLRRQLQVIRSALAIAWKNVPVTWPRRPPEAPSGLPWPSASVGQRLVVARHRSAARSGIRGRGRRRRPARAGSRRAASPGGSRGSSCAWRSWSHGRAGRAFRGVTPSASSSASPSTMKPPHSPWTGLVAAKRRMPARKFGRPPPACRHAVPDSRRAASRHRNCPAALRRRAARTARSRRPPCASRARHADRGR